MKRERGVVDVKLLAFYPKYKHFYVLVSFKCQMPSLCRGISKRHWRSLNERKKYAYLKKAERPTKISGEFGVISCNILNTPPTYMKQVRKR